MVSFGVKRRIEAEYARRLARIFAFVNKSIAGLTVPQAAEKILQIIATPQFDRLVESAVMNMLTMVKADNEKTWREAAAKGSFGRVLYGSLRDETSKRSTQSALRQILADNARLIKSVPRETANRITRKIFEEYQKGNRVPMIQRIVTAEAPWLSSKRAKLIARTEASKANAALTEVRSRDMGADWYIWRTSRDERVRSSHAYMEGVFVSWDGEPNPEQLSGDKNRFGNYHAGCCPNCRCYAEPLIDESQVAVKVKVYYAGSIRVMGRNQFLQWIGKRREAA